MDKIKIPISTAKVIKSITMSIFNDMVTRNASFTSILTAIYLSGVQHGIEISKARENATT